MYCVIVQAAIRLDVHKSRIASRHVHVATCFQCCCIHSFTSSLIVFILHVRVVTLHNGKSLSTGHQTVKSRAALLELIIAVEQVYQFLVVHGLLLACGLICSRSVASHLILIVTSWTCLLSVQQALNHVLVIDF